MRRITVAEVKEAYRKTGYVPIRGSYYRGGCACALGAVMAAREVVSDNPCEGLGIDEPYRYGFITGFDGRELSPDWSGVTEMHMIGYTDGQACAAAVFGEGDGGAG